ncbi:MAG: leucine-rich repeat domain-containing protein [Lachnospiraceae bacterium]|nr:leucine-rich repeat domain-containing protein [Lachnospiraceae bacterium]
MEPTKYLTPKKFLQCCGIERTKCNEMTIGSYLGEDFLNIQIYNEGSTFETYFITQIEDSGARFFMNPTGKGRRSVSLDKSEDIFKGLTVEVLQSVVESIETRTENPVLQHPDFESVLEKVREKKLLIDDEAVADIKSAENRKESVRFMILLLASMFQDYYGLTGISRRIKAYLEEGNRYREAVPDAIQVREGRTVIITPISDLHTNRTYVRRSDLLEIAEQKLKRLGKIGEKRFLLFYGSAGNGKSELARAYAREHAGKEYSREYWLTCPHGDDKMTLTSLCRNSSQGYGENDLVTILSEASSDVLLVIDNCNVEINTLINELYYHTGDATVLVTSRLSSLSGFDERNALRVFSENQAEFCLEVFRKNYEKKQMTGILTLSATDQVIANEICRKVYYNPLFISMIASFLREHCSQISVSAFNTKLQSGLLEAFPKYSQLDFRKDDPEPMRMEPLDVLKVILSEELHCIRFFAEEERQVMHLMLLFPAEPLSIDLVSKILGDNEEQFLMRTVIEQLLDISLLQREENCIMIHPLVSELIQSGILMDNGVPILYEDEVKDAFYSHILKNTLLLQQKDIRDYLHLIHEIFSAIRKPDPMLCLVLQAYCDRRRCMRLLRENVAFNEDPSTLFYWDTDEGRVFALWNFHTKTEQILLDLASRRRNGRYFRQQYNAVGSDQSETALLQKNVEGKAASDAQLLLFYEGTAVYKEPILLDLSRGISGHAIRSIPDFYMRRIKRPFRISLPEGLKEIGDWAFDYNRGLAGRLDLPDSVEVIGKGAFHSCTNLTGELKLPKHLKVIEDLAFCYCTGFTGSLILPDGLESIGNMAFCLCRGLVGLVNCPDSLKKVGENVFYNSRLIQSEGFMKLMSESIPEKSTATHELYISPFAEAIENEAFYGRTDIAGELKLPASVTEIGEQAFYQCGRITGSPAFSSLLKRIGSGAFFACVSLTGGLDLPDSLIELGDAAFFNCSGLNGLLRLPRNMEVIPDGCFFMCSGLKAFSNIEELSGLREIREGAFFGCSGLTGNLYLPDNLEKIGVGAFDGCIGITGLYFSKSGKIRILREGSFGNCRGLKGTLHIPLSMESVGAGCFMNCGYDTCVVHNRNCELQQFFIDPHVVLVGYEDSTAEAYAKQFGNPFRVLE